MFLGLSSIIFSSFEDFTEKKEASRESEVSGYSREELINKGEWLLICSDGQHDEVSNYSLDHNGCRIE